MHDTLVMRDNSLKLVPGLATSVGSRSTRPPGASTLRKGVKFHDGAPFTADDVVFSYERAQHPNSQLRQYSNPVGKPRKIDDYTVEFVQDKPNPITLEHATTIYIMSKAWATKHKVERPLDFKGKEETYASLHANGTGPWILVSREPGVKTVLKRNPDWWGIADGRATGNVTDVVYTQVSADATRTAALLSGQVDFILDPPPQDMRRLEENKDLKVIRGQENRIVFFGFDQHRDELLYSNVKGKNPFKDARVRQAVYQAIDIEAIKARTMRGFCAAHRRHHAVDPRVEPGRREAPAVRSGARQAAAGRRRLSERFRGHARLPEQSLRQRRRDLHRRGRDAEQDRHHDQGHHAATRDLLPEAREVRHQHVHARLGRCDHRCADDAVAGAAFEGRQDRQRLLQLWPLLNPKLDELIDAAAVETNAEKRRETIRQAIAEHNTQVHHVPLHRQMIPWAMRSNVTVVHRPDNVLNLETTKVGGTP